MDRTFLEHRAKLLDLAAFLDRCDRCASDGDGDYRLKALRGALKLLLDEQPDRARRILEQFSDPTTALLDAAPGKGAAGVPNS